MFSETDLVAAVERHLLQVAETCRGLFVARTAAARPARRAPLRERLSPPKPSAAEPALAANLAAEAKRWRSRGAGFSAVSADTCAVQTLTPPSTPPQATQGRNTAATASALGDGETQPITLFITPGKAVFLSVKRRRLSKRPEESVDLSAAERLHHRRLRDCGFAVHVIAAETPADARDQVTSLLKRLGLVFNA